MSDKSIYIPVELDPSIPAHAKALQEYNNMYKPMGITRVQWATDKVANESDHAQVIEMEVKARQPAIEVPGSARQERGDEV